MPNAFEQPWALLGAAVLVLFGLLTYRSICPQKRRWWQWLIPLAVAAVGLGLDFLVVTDLEKVRGTIATLLKAVENEDCAAVAGLIAPDYSDSRHETKAQLMARCRQELDGQTVQTLKQRGAEIDLSDWNATVMLNLFIRFEPESRIARQYKAVALARVRLYLGKRPDGNWLIDRAELLEVDQFPVSWRDL
ncbi:hypothetical protein [Anaerobaca lacustris]|uniref:DUF4878 domain-containing protein n=1 Tax=Anaerobaca lacustris TaxID=3044600 RepID=A0AAW6TV87_9BACT|nr:hypothetical protein [Sedimentisphaerales bacterium M17dextr]